MIDHSPADAYDGPATLVSDATSLEVEVALRGVFQPLDGLYHWYGRVGGDDAVDALVDTRADVSLRTPHGEVAARLSDRDPWGRYRVSGTGRPPFALSRSDD